ncbi:radical SAM protein [Desulforhopalus singaporensis]|uniref:Radical SAM superfamily protein n=1 Tax=Desulforhopalus singaporensis TaxID=91360 RepID=A0A1H0TIW3_9BACT|nr:radical SAM protein [Desulforhopalus singaporensis]SDP53486.1 Radical SAM superfamily protein [Desulforhopalus singaporensis]
MNHPDTLPSLVYADKDGNITDFPELGMCGMANRDHYRPELSELIPLPHGSELFTLPGRLPIGWEKQASQPVLLDRDPFSPDHVLQAVAAFIAPAHTSVYSSSYQTLPDAPTLPLFAYTAVGWHKGQFWVAAFRSDRDKRQDADQYDQADVIDRTRRMLKQCSDNRLVQHLGKCCLTYGCPAARNYFLRRWEAPLPTSPSCNARCLGCISLQESGCCPATQDRIKFVPTPKEICEMAVPHLDNAENPIVSFGQGCEGEPLLQADVIEEAIKKIRSKTAKGTVNLNSNASLPGKIAKLAKSGLDSLRVSLNSAQAEYYSRYYRPKNYYFSDVLQSIDRMKDAGGFVSLNYFILPGFSDSEPEFDALCTLIRNHSPDLIQLRNLNMDPEWYLDTLNLPEKTHAFGIRQWHHLLQIEFPRLRFGYFNPQVNPQHISDRTYQS